MTPFYLMYGREPSIPLHTIVSLPHPEALEPEDFTRTCTLAMDRNLMIDKENYETYYRRAAVTYKHDRRASTYRQVSVDLVPIQKDGNKNGQGHGR